MKRAQADAQSPSLSCKRDQLGGESNETDGLQSRCCLHRMVCPLVCLDSGIDHRGSRVAREIISESLSDMIGSAFTVLVKKSPLYIFGP
jgi:hypothetical protein